MAMKDAIGCGGRAGGGGAVGNGGSGGGDVGEGAIGGADGGGGDGEGEMGGFSGGGEGKGTDGGGMYTFVLASPKTLSPSDAQIMASILDAAKMTDTADTMRTSSGFRSDSTVGRMVGVSPRISSSTGSFAKPRFVPR